MDYFVLESVEVLTLQKSNIIRRLTQVLCITVLSV